MFMKRDLMCRALAAAAKAFLSNLSPSCRPRAQPSAYRMLNSLCWCSNGSVRQAVCNVRTFRVALLPPGGRLGAGGRGDPDAHRRGLRQDGRAGQHHVGPVDLHGRARRDRHDAQVMLQNSMDAFLGDAMARRFLEGGLIIILLAPDDVALCPLIIR
eukprot:scaffold353343_cov32-Prasinocladus_malaysianus.AAC.1